MPEDDRDIRLMTVALVDPHPLSRASMRSMLESARPDFKVRAFADAVGLLSAAKRGTAVDLVLVDIGSTGIRDAAVQAALAALAERLSGVPVVLLAEDAVLEDMVAAMQSGVRGYVPKSLEPAEAIQALRLVHAGGMFLPAGVIVDFFNGHAAAAARADYAHPHGGLLALTPRESEVLARIQQGKPNKIIAHELRLCEGTVKVYTRRLMRKLGVSNRTEAALAARRLAEYAPEPDRRHR